MESAYCCCRGVCPSGSGGGPPPGVLEEEDDDEDKEVEVVFRCGMAPKTCGEGSVEGKRCSPPKALRPNSTTSATERGTVWHFASRPPKRKIAPSSGPPLDDPPFIFGHPPMMMRMK